MESNRPVIRKARKSVAGPRPARSLAKKIRRIPIGTRYPEDEVLELDLIAKRLDHDDRAKVIRIALDEYRERQKAAGVI